MVYTPLLIRSLKHTRNQLAGKNKLLGELAEEYPIILFDACALFGIYGIIPSSKSVRESAKLFRELSKDVDIYTTDGIANEYLSVNPNGFSSNERDELIGLLRFRENILSPTEEQQGVINHYTDRYAGGIREELEWLNRSSLSKNDLELLLLGAALSKNQRTAIITNDCSIHVGLGHILIRERDLQLESFKRQGYNGFVKMVGKKYKEATV